MGPQPPSPGGLLRVAPETVGAQWEPFFGRDIRGRAKGGYDAGVKLVESVELFSHLANIGDSRSLVIHPASTTHRQLTEEQLSAAGAGAEVVRLSIGIESPADIIADLDQALARAGS